MGYTHYFRKQRAFTNEQWMRITEDTLALFSYAPYKLEDGLAEGGKPEANEKWIDFNGSGEDSHETFRLLPGEPGTNEGWFCKTARKPYDEMVVSVLALANTHAPGVLSIGSDGTHDNWEPALVWAENIVGIPLENPIEK